MKIRLLLLCALILLSSCATGYKNINPQNLNYSSSEEKEGVKIEYKYDVLKKKYAKKEKKKGINVIAIKVANNSNNDLIFGENIVLTDSNNNTINLLNNNEIFKPLKQNVATYLLYLLLTPLNIFTTESNEFGQQEQTSSIPVGLVIGPGITLINTITAGSANKKFKDEIHIQNLKNKTIKRGDTISGIIGVSSTGYNNLKISIQ